MQKGLANVPICATILVSKQITPRFCHALKLYIIKNIGGCASHYTAKRNRFFACKRVKGGVNP